MNCIPGAGILGQPRGRIFRLLKESALLGATALALSSCNAPASEPDSPPGSPELSYRIEYVLTPQPSAGGTRVDLVLTQSRRLLRRFNMRRDRIESSSVVGDGLVQIDDDRIVWEPPSGGGTLSWFVPIDHQRSQGEYDAHINADWAVFRAEDAMPAALTRTLKGAIGETHLAFDLPSGWTSLTQYFGRENRYAINNPFRRFDRPTGWILLGKIGRRNEDIAGVRVIVAGPVGHSVRRMDILALLQWTLPELVKILPEFPDRLTVVSAGAPMWRGGLSAPASIFVHTDRPLLSENGTSTLLHEVMHVTMGLRAKNDADWIVEGLAEYYGLELLRRSGTISQRRHANSMRELREWGTQADRLCQDRSSGAVTARAVSVFDALDRDLREKTAFSLDDVLRQLVTDDKDITVASLQSAAKELAGRMPAAIADRNLPGCNG